MMQVKTMGDVGALVRSARTARGMTQADLAAQLRMSRDWVVRLEKGHPRLEAQRVLDALRVVGVQLEATVADGPALSIEDPEADRLARELAERTGETLTEVVVVALRERLARQTGRTGVIPLRGELAAIRRRCAALPASDDRSAEEIVGYDDRGLPS
jgi:antitoxin VapB